MHESHLEFEVPTCAAVREPVWGQLAQLVVIPLFLIFGIAGIANENWIAIGLAAGLGPLWFRLWRAQRWVRLVWFDEDRYVIAARRREWCDALVAANDTPALEVSTR